MEADNIRLAHRLVHSLKSNAGQLNITVLQQLAGEIENLLLDGSNLVTPHQMAALEQELNAALEKLSPLVRTPAPAAPPAEPVDKAAACLLLEELGPLLDSGNPECLKYIDRLQLLPGTEELILQMENLDFEHAKTSMNELKMKFTGEK